MLKLPSVFVTGTDTGVGKTVVSALLGLIYSHLGVKTAYFKPVATGGDGDPRFVASILGLAEPLERLCPYVFTQPCSPHLASRLEGKPIEMAVILESYTYLSQKYQAIIVEGAGGLLVPLGSGRFISHLVQDLSLPLLVVARPGLGTLNHTLLTLAVAGVQGLKVAGVIINRYPSLPDPATKDNPGTIAELSGSPVLALVPEMAESNLDILQLEKAAQDILRSHGHLIEHLKKFA